MSTIFIRILLLISVIFSNTSSLFAAAYNNTDEDEIIATTTDEVDRQFSGFEGVEIKELGPKSLKEKFYEAAKLDDETCMREIIDQIEFYHLDALLRIVAKFDRIEVIEDIINNTRYSFDINKADSKKNSPLHYAAQHNSVRVVKFLLQHKANVYLTNYNQDTALHLAAAHGNLFVVQKLVKAQADIMSVNAQGLTALELAMQNGHHDVVSYLRDKLSILEKLALGLKSTLSISSADPQ